MDWQPISSAPRDKRILLCSTRKGTRYPIVVGKWHERMQQWQSDPGAWPMHPTHWMPLPDIPDLF